MEEVKNETKRDCTTELQDSLKTYQGATLLSVVFLCCLSFALFITAGWFSGPDPKECCVAAMFPGFMAFVATLSLVCRVAHLLFLPNRVINVQEDNGSPAMDVLYGLLFIPAYFFYLVARTNECIRDFPVVVLLAWVSLPFAIFWLCSSLNWQRTAYELGTGNVWRPIQTMAELHGKWHKKCAPLIFFRAVSSFAALLYFASGDWPWQPLFKNLFCAMTIYHVVLICSCVLMLATDTENPYPRDVYLCSMQFNVVILISGWILTGVVFILIPSFSWWRSSVVLLFFSMAAYTIQTFMYVDYFNSTQRLAQRAPLPISVPSSAPPAPLPVVSPHVEEAKVEYLKQTSIPGGYNPLETTESSFS